MTAMTEPSRSLEARVAALETHVSQLTQQVQRSAQDAAAARVLAGGADRDVDQIRGEIRDFRHAATTSFNALREDMTEMRGKLDATAAGQQQIVDLLTTLIGDRPEDTDSEQ
jgi:phage shock protein A